METFTKKIQGYKNKCYYPLQSGSRAAPKKRAAAIAVRRCICYTLYIIFPIFVILPDKGAIQYVCHGTSDYPPHLPPVCTKGRAAGRGGRYRTGRAAVLLRGKPAGGASGAGAKPGDGSQGTAAGQVGCYLPPEQGTPKADELPTFYAAVVQDTAIPGDLATDTGIALANMTLAAWDKGVGSCIMGAIDKPALTELLGIEEPQKLAFMVAFGYPTHKAAIVPMTEQTGVKYYLDENRDYCVPKRSAEEIAKSL